MDRELPAEVIRKGKARKFVIIAAVLTVLIVCYYALQALITPDLKRSKIKTSIAEIGTIEATVSASGVVVPEYEQIITSPVSSTIEKVFLNSGDSVSAGQSILHLNMEQLQLSLENLIDELEVQKNRKKQLSLDTEEAQINLKASYEIKKLQTQFIKSQYDRMKRLHEIGGAPKENLERAALNVDIANQEVDQLSRQIKNQQASLEVALEGLDLQISIQENKISEVRRQIALAEGRAGRDGIVTFVNADIGSSVNQGDVIARVANLSSFKVEASISDIHAGTLKNAGTVRLRIGKEILSGRIGSISPAVRNGIISFNVVPDDKSHPLLRPNLRADVFVVTSYQDNVVRVKNGPFYDGLVDQSVFVVEGERAVRKTVDIGATNFDYVAVEGEIVPGDEVIISDMKKFRHMDEVEIESE
jgi:HlyD family secretion protein